MAYQKKYWTQFIALNTSDTHLVELWQDTEDVLTAEEVLATDSPFIVEVMAMKHKFDTIIGKGCEVNLVSESDRKFLDGLYHVDPKEFIVRHYINGTISFLGYLNSEMYKETYSIDKNYATGTTGHDGFGLADRYYFLQSDESQYAGALSQYDIIKICLDKIGLPWTEIRIGLSTTFADFTGTASKTVLHETYVDAANFYDEDGEPMTVREVLVSCLQPYGAQIYAVGDTIYITDVELRVKGIEDNWTTLATLKRFTYSTDAYIASVSLDPHLTIQNIGFHGTGQGIEVSGGVNRQVVAYSPYASNDILPDVLRGIDEFTGVPASFTPWVDYYRRTLTGNYYMESLNASGFFEGSYYDGTVNGNSVQKEEPAYLKLTYVEPFVDLAQIKEAQRPYVTISGKTIEIDGEQVGAGININFDLLTTFTDSKVFRYMVLGGGGYTNYRIHLKCSIGSLYFDGDTETWVADSSKGFYIEIPDLTRERWVNVSALLPVAGSGGAEALLSGDLNVIFNSKIEVFSALLGWQNHGDRFTRTAMQWIKNLNIETRNEDDSTISSNDIEYIGILDERFKEEGKKITLTQGTDAYATDLGKLLWLDGSDYKSIKEHTRSAQTFEIEKLLLNSIVSNYRHGFIKLTNMKLKADFNVFNVLTDDLISGKVFMLKSVKFDYAYNTAEVDLWETSPDSLTIIES